MIEERLVGLLREAMTTAEVLGPGDDPPEIELTKPKQKEHGDFATNVALQIARRAGRPPREVAEEIVARVPVAAFVERVEVAGPGFINLFVADDWLYDVLRDVVARGADFGRDEPSERSVQV
jgi:arginyl-tRNA synthetase